MEISYQITAPPISAAQLDQDTRHAFAQATRGTLSLVELFNYTERLSEAGRAEAARRLCQRWLAHAPSPIRYAADFDLAVLLEHTALTAGAGASYRMALANQPGWRAAHQHLSAVLERARQCEPPHWPPAQRDDSASPPVSILIPTHNRAGYVELALRSALAQTYDNLHIIVSDNGDDEATRERIAPYLEKYPAIRYARTTGLSAIENFQHCYALAQSDYVNFLMDDDLFHPDKIRKMMGHMLAQPHLGLVTSVRQVIDQHGRRISAPPPFQPAFKSNTLIAGIPLGRKILSEPGSIVGEPTTSLFRKSDLGEHFGMFQGRQYAVLPDIASWLAILSHKDCLYLTEPLSCFRIHDGQDQRQRPTRIKGRIEGLQLFCDAYEHSPFLPHDGATHDLLKADLSDFMERILSARQDIKSACDLESMHATIRQATSILLR